MSSTLIIPKLRGFFYFLIGLIKRKNKNLEERKYKLNIKQQISGFNYFFIYLTFSRHNVHIAVTNIWGNLIMGDTPGSLGYLQSSRNTYRAFFEVGERIAWQLRLLQINQVIVFFRGHSFLKRAVFSGLFQREWITLLGLYDISPITFNGCRFKKHRRRRVRRIQRGFRFK